IEGRQPRALTIKLLLRGIPLDWADQRAPPSDFVDGGYRKRDTKNCLQRQVAETTHWWPVPRHGDTVISCEWRNRGHLQHWSAINRRDATAWLRVQPARHRLRAPAGSQSTQAPRRRGTPPRTRRSVAQSQRRISDRPR